MKWHLCYSILFVSVLFSLDDYAQDLAIPPYYPNAVICSGDIFAGSERALAKTHEAKGEAKVLLTIDDLKNSGLLVPDNQMRSHKPPITKAPESSRVAEETVNVTIDTAYIYAIYREQDNDFHMIIGNGRTDARMFILNSEVSGLPGNHSDNLLEIARAKIIKRFGDIPCDNGKRKPLNTFIPVKITGSLFFDFNHGAEEIGVGPYKPATVWEIHPVTSLEFE